MVGGASSGGAKAHAVERTASGPAGLNASLVNMLVSYSDPCLLPSAMSASTCEAVTAEASCNAAWRDPELQRDTSYVAEIGGLTVNVHGRDIAGGLSTGVGGPTLALQSARALPSLFR